MTVAQASAVACNTVPSCCDARGVVCMSGAVFGRGMAPGAALREFTQRLAPPSLTRIMHLRNARSVAYYANGLPRTWLAVALAPADQLRFDPLQGCIDIRNTLMAARYAESTFSAGDRTPVRSKRSRKQSGGLLRQSYAPPTDIPPAAEARTSDSEDSAGVAAGRTGAAGVARL